MNGMNIAYWIVAGLLALFYFYSGTLKVSRSRDQLRPMMDWVDRVPLPALRALGTVEILGATGMVLPPMTGIAPSLAPAAAIGFVLLQTGAIAHLPLIPPAPAPPRRPVRQQRLDPCPLGTSQRHTSTNDQMIRRKRSGGVFHGRRHPVNPEKGSA